MPRLHCNYESSSDRLLVELFQTLFTSLSIKPNSGGSSSAQKKAASLIKGRRLR